MNINTNSLKKMNHDEYHHSSTMTTKVDDDDNITMSTSTRYEEEDDDDDTIKSSTTTVIENNNSNNSTNNNKSSIHKRTKLQLFLSHITPSREKLSEQFSFLQQQPKNNVNQQGKLNNRNQPNSRQYAFGKSAKPYSEGFNVAWF